MIHPGAVLRVTLVVAAIALLPHHGRAQSADDQELCYEARYDSSAQSSAVYPYPVRWLVRPSVARRPVIALDTVPYWLRGHYESAWVRRGNSVFFFIEGGEAGGSYTLVARGDSLTGTVQRMGPAHEPPFGLVAWRIPCPPEPKLPHNPGLLLSGSEAGLALTRVAGSSESSRLIHVAAGETMPAAEAQRR